MMKRLVWFVGGAAAGIAGAGVAKKKVKAAAAEMAGHFDHYVCRNYLGIRGERPPQAMPELLKTGLCRAGQDQQGQQQRR